MTDRDAFLVALAENEDDTTTRLVYADWLDERGEHEEADRQRRWPAAKAWLVQLCQESLDAAEADNDEVPDEGNPYSFFGITYPKLVDLGQRALDSADEHGIDVYCGANEDMMEVLRAHSQEFWENWSIVTGVRLPPDVGEKSYFTCSC